ncbi:MAG TPA: ComF family protein [Desulfobulbus sp.]|nr:ComF family protein [Desulfobulbus sp.]
MITLPGRSLASSLLAGARDLFFPAFCLGCGRQLGTGRPPLLCPDCRAALVFSHSPCCTCCGLPFPCGSDHLCGDCLQDLYGFDRACFAVLYSGPVPRLVQELKFLGRTTVLATMASLTVLSGAADRLTEPDLVLPVPLHPSRLRRRGFNQSLLIARACFPNWRARIDPDLLVRSRPTVPQTSLSGRSRRRNLRGAFALRRNDRLRNGRILLVDDVFTTGSTVRECVAVLRRAGAARIEVFTLSRSP